MFHLFISYMWEQDLSLYTVKHVHTVTSRSINKSPVLKGHIDLSFIENVIWVEPLLRGHLSYKVGPKDDLLTQVWLI